MTVLLAVGAKVTRADIPCLCARLADLLRGRAGPGQVVCDVSQARADVVTIEALARLRLTAGRHGWRFSTHGATDDLLVLFSLMGLGGIFFSGRQALRQVEEREQALGVEEVVDAGDPAAGDLQDDQRPRHVAGTIEIRTVLGEGGQTVRDERDQA